MNIGHRIKLLRISHKLSKKQLAEKVHVDPGTVGKWESGKIKNIGTSKLSALSLALETSPLYLLGVSSSSVPECFGKKIPLLSQSIPIEELFSDENSRFFSIDDSIYADFAICVEDNSMQGAGIFQGDIALFLRSNQVKEGEVAAVIFSDRVAIRRVFQEAGLPILQSENGFSPLVIAEAENVILGSLYGILHFNR